MSKLVYGCGINDIKGSKKENYYTVWQNVLTRCYSKIEHIRKPTYKDCEIDIRWQRLSEFKKWYDNYYIHGYELDKDLYIPNNKIYSPDTCLFIPNSINNILRLLNSKGYRIRPNGKYQANISINNKQKCLGTYTTEKEAHNVYIQAKANHFMNVADEWWHKDEKIATGLYRNSEALLGNDWRKSLD